jgi:Na+-driven multidrug efflux pump
VRWCGWGSANPVAGPAFALDGVLVGAGDLRFLAKAMLGVAATFALGAALTLATGAGLWALWATLTAAMTVRTALMSGRFPLGQMGQPRFDHDQLTVPLRR